jgi:hypothetical protein
MRADCNIKEGHKNATRTIDRKENSERSETKGI